MPTLRSAEQLSWIGERSSLGPIMSADMKTFRVDSATIRPRQPWTQHQIHRCLLVPGLILIRNDDIRNTIVYAQAIVCSASPLISGMKSNYRLCTMLSALVDRFGERTDVRIRVFRAASWSFVGGYPK
jgi:hypothetical protein